MLLTLTLLACIVPQTATSSAPDRPQGATPSAPQQQPAPPPPPPPNATSSTDDNAQAGNTTPANPDAGTSQHKKSKKKHKKTDRPEIKINDATTSDQPVDRPNTTPHPDTGTGPK